MSKSIRWPVFLALVLVFSILVGSIGFASQPAYAQGSSDLTQLFASTDGALSLRLPATWVAIDDTGNPDLALFSTIIFFGENQAAAEARRAYNLGQTSNVPGLGGAVVVVDPAQFQQLAGQPLTPDSAVAAVVAGTEANGGSTQVGATAYQTTAGNPAVYAVTSDPNSDLLAFVVAVEFTGAVVLASAENRTADFAGSSDLLTAILDSVSAPAEAATTPPNNGGTGLGGGLGGTGLVSGESADKTFVTSDDGSLSILLPKDWVFEDQLATNGLFIFGETQAEAENRATFWLSNELVTVAGSGGFVAEIEWSSISADAQTFDLNAGLTAFLSNLGHSEAEEFQEVTIGGQTPAVYTVLTYPSQKTFVALIAFDLKLGIVATSAPNATFDENRNLLLEVMQSVSIPAGQPPTTGPGTTGLGGTGLGGGTASTGQTVAASDNSLSVVLPDGWVSQDNMASAGYFAFGENAAELQNRITFWETDSSIPITGLGGVITLYNYADLGYTADTMDPVTTLDNFIQNLSLVTVQPTQTFNIAGVVASYAVVEWGASQGVLMIIPFQERLALVYASTTAANINANLTLLLSVAETVRVPAETGGSGGLGGGTTGAGGGKKNQ